MMPDYASALVEYLRADAALTAIVAAQRILMEVPSGIEIKSQNHLVVNKSGGPGADPYLPVWRVRLDLLHFGVNGYEGMRMARATSGLLLSSSRQTGFTSRGVLFRNVVAHSAPVQSETPEGWPFVLLVIGALVYDEVEVPA